MSSHACIVSRGQEVMSSLECTVSRGKYQVMSSLGEWSSE